MPYRFKVFYTPEHVLLEKNIFKKWLTLHWWRISNERRKKNQNQSLINVLPCTLFYTYIVQWQHVRLKKECFCRNWEKRQHIATWLDLQSFFHYDGGIVRPSLQYDVDVMHSLWTTNVFELQAKKGNPICERHFGYPLYFLFSKNFPFLSLLLVVLNLLQHSSCI